MLSWIEIDKNRYKNNFEFILIIIKTVRNNLFHGGKFPERHIHEVARNKKLLENCIIVLENLIEISPKVKKYFDDIA